MELGGQGEKDETNALLVSHLDVEDGARISGNLRGYYFSTGIVSN